MRTSILFLCALPVLAVGGLLLATGQRQPVPNASSAARSHPGDGAIRALVCARPFTLEQSTPHYWRAGSPSYSAGWLLVLEVDPQYVQPRNTAEPVLYVGHETAERINHGWKSGRVVAVVPSTAGPDGAPTLDLAQAPVWFGAPELPERIDAAAIEREAAKATDARPFSAAEIAEALARCGGPIRFESRADLDELAAQLILEHSPEEHDLAQGLLVPRSR